MAFCTECGAPARAQTNFCTSCGTKLVTLVPAASTVKLPVSGDSSLDRARINHVHEAHQKAESTFTKTFGIDYRAALLVIIVDIMVWGGTMVTWGMLYLVEVLAAIAIAFVTYKIQRSWYGDDHDSAVIKAGILGLLTAIPVPVASLVAGPGGLIGLYKLIKNK